MKKIAILIVTALFGAVGVFAQNTTPVDLTKGTGRGIELSGTATLTSSERGGDYYLPTVEDYSMYRGIRFVLSNFKKLDENVSNNLCALNVYYTNENGEDKKASMTFGVKGKKNIKFDAFKDGSNVININPGSIKKISIGMGGSKQVDVQQVELIARDPQE